VVLALLPPNKLSRPPYCYNGLQEIK